MQNKISNLALIKIYNVLDYYLNQISFDTEFVTGFLLDKYYSSIFQYPKIVELPLYVNVSHSVFLYSKGIVCNKELPTHA